MAINQLSTANTFQEWLTTTATLVAVANNLTDNTNGGFVANSSIFIEGAAASLNVRTLANINTLRANTANISNISLESGSIVGNGTITMRDANIWSNIVSVNTTGNLSVGGDAFIYGNLTISGNVTLDSVGFDDLDVKGSANITNDLTVNGNTIGTNLTLSGNIARVNVTSNLAVGGDTFIYGNLTITGNTTLDSIGFNDLSVAGSVNSTNLNTSTANITLLTGTSNTAIYSTITAAIDSSIAFAIALG
jgi:predicted acyltransferase (DUF342 family)